MIKQVIMGLLSLVGRFRADKRGQIAIIFALSSTAIMAGMGSGIDLSRAYMARQKLSQVAALTCQYSTRPSVIEIANNTYSGTGGFAAYIAAVNAYATANLTSQNWTGTTPTAPSGTYFTATQASTSTGTATSTAPTNPVVEMTATVPTYFMQLLHIPQVTVHTKMNCLTGSTTPQIVTSQGPNNSVTNILSTGFEMSCTGWCAVAPNGSSNQLSSSSSATTSTPGYTDPTGTKWYIIGYCLEIDQTGVINTTSPEGSHTAELDCNSSSSSSTAANSSITTKAYLAPGYYELRYFYRSRVDYPNYDPTYICGSTASDVSWANDTNSANGTGVLRTNQINVYLDLANTSAIPLHTTIDGTQQLAGVNLIDMCVYSPTWIERSVKIRVTTPAYYWLSFAADGASDSVGGQLDNIRLCQETCSGSPQDNFPPSWLATNNGGVNKVLFEDTFESPVYTQDPYVSSAHTKGGNLANSLGLTSTSTCNSSVKSPPGWPCQTAGGWATAPYNEVMYWEQGSSQGTQYIALQGWNPTTSGDISAYGYTNSGDPINRSISRAFLLDPGYYAVSYDYKSMVDFSYDFVYNGNYWPVCTASPTVADSYSTFGMKHGYDYASSTLLSQYLSTNFMNAYVSHGKLVSTPIINSALGGAPTYNNPDGTTSSSPTVPLDNGSNFASYSASAVNPVIDTCYYSAGYGWVARTVNIKITKPGWYWLTFSAQGDPLTGAGQGPAIDDVKLTALGSLYMSGAPNTALTTIPVPAPQPDTAYSNSNAFNGFYIVADPQMPPAADQ